MSFVPPQFRQYPLNRTKSRRVTILAKNDLNSLLRSYGARHSIRSRFPATWEKSLALQFKNFNFSPVFGQKSAYRDFLRKGPHNVKIRNRVTDLPAKFEKIRQSGFRVIVRIVCTNGWTVERFNRTQFSEFSKWRNVQKHRNLEFKILGTPHDFRHSHKSLKSKKKKKKKKKKTQVLFWF